MKHIVFVAEYRGMQGDAYALNTVQYRFRPAVVGGEYGWMTLEYGPLLWSETGREMVITDPTAPTHSEQLAHLQASRS